jgi:hypothetical protein
MVLHPFLARPLQRLEWYSLPNRLVGSCVVEIPLILLHQPIQMPFAQDQEVVQALPPHAAPKPFTDRICFGRSVRCLQDLNESATACQVRGCIQDQSMVAGLCPLAKRLFGNLEKGMHVVAREGKEWEVHCLPFESGFRL